MNGFGWTGWLVFAAGNAVATGRRIGVMVGGPRLPAATLDARLNDPASRFAAADGR